MSSYSKPTSSSLARTSPSSNNAYVSKYSKGDNNAPVKKRTPSKSLESPAKTNVSNTSNTPNRRYHFVVSDNNTTPSDASSTPSKTASNKDEGATFSSKVDSTKLETIASFDDNEGIPKIT